MRPLERIVLAVLFFAVAIGALVFNVYFAASLIRSLQTTQYIPVVIPAPPPEIVEPASPCPRCGGTGHADGLEVVPIKDRP